MNPYHSSFSFSLEIQDELLQSCECLAPLPASETDYISAHITRSQPARYTTYIPFLQLHITRRDRCAVFEFAIVEYLGRLSALTKATVISLKQSKMATSDDASAVDLDNSAKPSPAAFAQARATRPEICGTEAPERPYPIYLRGMVERGFGRGGKDLGCPTGECSLYASVLMICRH